MVPSSFPCFHFLPSFTLSPSFPPSIPPDAFISSSSSSSISFSSSFSSSSCSSLTPLSSPFNPSLLPPQPPPPPRAHRKASRSSDGPGKLVKVLGGGKHKGSYSQTSPKECSDHWTGKCSGVPQGLFSFHSTRAKRSLFTLSWDTRFRDPESPSAKRSAGRGKMDK
ncbi:hypothetical protein E2C01_045161 [Portunus trituberculatus]|uniref:Uncharacterized protein n=1 Tax=Portunus trituberculatus TaxID=210409 RepID=A0A5B7G123_PORTR|nr:hypothetical protein [Portunus trituberculatus]